METAATGLTPPDDRLDEILAAYLEAVDAGWAPGRRAFLERYPDWRHDLETFFASQDEVDLLAQPFRTPQAPPAPGSEATVAIEGTRGGPGPLPRSFGGYELQEELARGGMGVVFRARQTGLNRTVALKMIRTGPSASADEVRRFRNEAEAAALMSHPHVVPIYEVGEHDGQPFFSMKLIEGGSLAEQVGRFRDRPRQAARFLATVARAVHYAHQRGILHRDLKPANILLDEGGEPLVTDFGLAKRVEEGSRLTQSNAIVGTPCYMAPEQALGKGAELTTAADVYSLGAILYELLTGRPPFKADSVLETLLQVRQEAPPPPHQSNPRVDRDLETVCLKCLQKEPARRYPSAEALADDLERWLAGEVVRARRAGPWERLRKWARRSPASALLTGLVGVVVVLCLVGLGMTVQLREARRAWREEAEARQAAEAAHQEAEQARQAAERARQEALAQKREAESTRNAYSLVSARLALENGDVAQAVSFLDECTPGQRGWEWAYLQNLSRGGKPALGRAPLMKEALSYLRDLARREVPAARGPGGPVLAFSPDGKRVASTGRDGTVQLWDRSTGRDVLPLDGAGRLVWSVAFSPDGKWLATAAGGGEVRVWDASTGQKVGQIEAGATATALSPDGTRLATAGKDHAVRVWDAAGGRPLLTLRGHAGPVTRLAFSPDGKRLAGASADRTVSVWDAATGQLQLTLRGHGGAVRGLAFSPDGQRLASASDDKTVKVWDARAGRNLLTLRGHTGAAHAVAFSPDGLRLASGSADRTVRVWDAATGLEVLSLPGQASAVLEVGFSPDGRRLTCVGADKTAKAWDTGPSGKK
jgi:predicted Ser/Thr protein kinase